MQPQQILKKYFGYETFREHQLEVIETLVDGKDAFVLMPTGIGKSICYQIPSIMREGVGIVISPLIALMQDQVGALRQSGVSAEFLNSSLSREEAQLVEKQVVSGKADILYVAPERLQTGYFQRFIRNFPIAVFAIDEAHCVSQWGHDFRPEYLRIAEVTDSFPKVPRVALTATADAVTRRDILEKLKLAQAGQFISSFDRANINYRVQLKNKDKQQLYDFIRSEHPGEPGIVYVRTRRRADQIAAWLQEKGLPAFSYHAGLDPHTRTKRQRQFVYDDGLIIVATIAFGMGIDKPDVRFVAHLDLPASMEAYYQETGRAGRDGKPADAWMVYSLADVVAMRKLLDQSEGDEAFKHVQQRKLEALLGYGEAVGCRREALLGYFGETYPAPCRHCDNCSQTVEAWDGTVAAQKALSCVYRTGQRFGAAHLTDILVGNSNERVLRLRHDRLKTFGAGKELLPKEWRSVYRQLLAAGMLSVNIGKISGYRLTEKSLSVLRGERKIRFRKDPLLIKHKKTGKTSKTPGPDLIDGDARQLFEKLRRLRLDLSKKLGVPPFVIFHDKTLTEMAIRKPNSRGEFLQISGVGEQKAERFGEIFLKAIAAGKIDHPS
jgi:ATP-dependent DNA helicase RecQ